MTKKRQHGTSGKRQYKYAKYDKQVGSQSKLEVGMLGVLVSHDRGKEKFCRQDSFRILNHFAEQMYGSEKELDKEEPDSDGEDIEKSLSQELEAIRESSQAKNQEKRRFSVVKSGCNNLVFVRFRNDISPSALVDKMVTGISCHDIASQNIPCVRSVLRVHPVEFNCQAYLDVMQRDVPAFIAKKFSEIADTVTVKEFNITYKSRNNTHLDKEKVKTDLFEDIKISVPDWKFNCRTDSVLIMIDVIRAVAMVSVVRDHLKYKKYNVSQLLQQLHNPNKDKIETNINEKVENPEISSLNDPDVCGKPDEVKSCCDENSETASKLQSVCDDESSKDEINDACKLEKDNEVEPNVSPDPRHDDGAST